jgi:hypothetical protein
MRVHSIILFFLVCTVVQGQEKPVVEKLSESNIEFCSKNDLLKYSTGGEKWKAEVRKLTQSNSVDGSDDSILCLGSSSFRLWNSIGVDMAPYKMVRRAYGGAKYCDLAIHTQQLIDGLRFRAVIIFVGNDITGSVTDKSPEEIVRLSSLVMATIRSQKPAVPIFLIAVTPTPSRFKHWSKTEKANLALEGLAKSLPNTFFVKTDTKYLDANQAPRPELFGKDMLHQNQQGYNLWASIIKESLAANLK